MSPTTCFFPSVPRTIVHKFLCSVLVLCLILLQCQNISGLYNSRFDDDDRNLPDCGIEVQKSTNLNFGYIDWDGAHYNGSINCSYVIKLAPWETVTLTFLKFRLPSTTRNCASGYLTVGTLGHVGTRLCSERDVPLPRKRILRGDSAVITYFSKAAEHDAFMIKYVVVNESLCDRTLNLHAGSNANVSFPSPSDNPQNKTCITRLVAPIGQLIRLTFHYLGSSGDTSNASGWDPVSNGDSEKCKGIKGIITVGNHLERISDSFSSFRICQHFVPPEYVSRGHTLWMDLADLSVFSERNFKIEYHVLPKAECTEDQFRCSAVQCISRKKLCDGRRDCVNGLDEYCVHSSAPVCPFGYTSYRLQYTLPEAVCLKNCSCRVEGASADF